MICIWDYVVLLPLNTSIASLLRADPYYNFEYFATSNCNLDSKKLLRHSLKAGDSKDAEMGMDLSTIFRIFHIYKKKPTSIEEFSKYAKFHKNPLQTHRPQTCQFLKKKCMPGGKALWWGLFFVWMTKSEKRDIVDAVHYEIMISRQIWIL